jgi:anti-sigma regulatory factor (Ser/Thr protein kinase)
MPGDRNGYREWVTVSGGSGGDWDSHAGYVHEAVYYDSTARFVHATAPLLRHALAGGADVALVCSDANNRALAEALEDDDRVLVLPRPEIYQKAVTAVAYFRDYVHDRVASGSRRVCILGEVDFGADSRALDEWRRYEALLNFAMTPFPLWSLCGYDRGVLPDGVLATGELTHPYLRQDGIQVRSPTYVDPGELLRLVDADGDLVPEVEPALTIPEVLDFGDLHREVKELLLAEGMGRERVEDVVIAVHEVTTNGLRHGEPPVTLRLWLSPGRVVCTVTDRGAGYDDPFAGYLRGGGDELPEGRFGLWLARQLCDEVVTSRTPEGFTTRLVVKH